MQLSRAPFSVAIGLLLALGGCTSSAPVGTASAPVVYRLAPGDKVRMTVFNEPTLSGEFSVNAAGGLALPLIGNIDVAGKSREDAQEAIRSRFAAGFLKNPSISLEMLSYRPFYILGEVARPGEYPYSVGLTVQQAIAIAGGYSYRAKQDKVRLEHAGKPGAEEVDASTANVAPGDTIRVKERHF